MDSWQKDSALTWTRTSNRRRSSIQPNPQLRVGALLDLSSLIVVTMIGANHVLFGSILIKPTIQTTKHKSKFVCFI